LVQGVEVGATGLLVAVGINLMVVVTSIEVGVSFFSNSNFYWRLHAIENALYLRT
jgi:hypothetical protein